MLDQIMKKKYLTKHQQNIALTKKIEKSKQEMQKLEEKLAAKDAIID
jgi:hypothetical protein